MACLSSSRESVRVLACHAAWSVRVPGKKRKKPPEMSKKHEKKKKQLHDQDAVAMLMPDSIIAREKDHDDCLSVRR